MSSIVPISSHRRYRFPSIDLPESFLDFSRCFGLTRMGAPKRFAFRRRKNGCEVWLEFTGGLSLNMSVEYGYFKDRATGRAWAMAFAKRHGFIAMEKARQRA